MHDLLRGKRGTALNAGGDTMKNGLKTSPAPTAWRVNWLLALALVLLSQSALADEPIKGAFGQVLGNAFDATTATRTKLDRGSLLFSFFPPEQTPILTEFTALASPISFRIFAIFATGKSEGQKACLDNALGLFSIISKKYSGDQYGASIYELPDNHGYVLKQCKTGRSIHVTCDEKGELELSYLDDALHQAAEVEQEEVNQISSDFQAARYDKILPRVRELAEQKYPFAETLMGLMYRKGAGVVHDDEKAEWGYGTISMGIPVRRLRSA
jgi:hypothetical protein